MARFNKKISKGMIVQLKDYKKKVPKKVSNQLFPLFDCSSREDRIIRNVWIFFVIGVFAFSSILWKFQGNIFVDDFDLNDTMTMGYW